MSVGLFLCLHEPQADAWGWAAGAIVTPGLIDIHTHLFRGADYFGIDADTIAGAALDLIG